MFTIGEVWLPFLGNSFGERGERAYFINMECCAEVSDKSSIWWKIPFIKLKLRKFELMNCLNTKQKPKHLYLWWPK